MKIVRTWKKAICRWGLTARVPAPVSMISVSEVELTDTELETVYGGLDALNGDLNGNNVLNNPLAGNQVSALNGTQALNGNALGVPVLSPGATTTGGTVGNFGSFNQGNLGSFNQS